MRLESLTLLVLFATGAALAYWAATTQQTEKFGPVLTSTGARIMDAGGTRRQCRVAGVDVTEMEAAPGEAHATSAKCLVPRSLLRPVPGTLQLTGKLPADLQLLQGLLRTGPVTTAYCPPRSTLCEVTFTRHASSASVGEYNRTMLARFGLGATQVGDTQSSGTQYVSMPGSPGPQRTTLRVAPDGGRHVLVYKYASMTTAENPRDLFFSAGRNTDDDVALDPDSGQKSYCSYATGEDAWAGFPFQRVVLEARRGPQVMASFTFRATRSRLDWFQAKNLIEASVGGRSLPEAAFSANAFAAFTPYDDDLRVHWLVLAGNTLRGPAASASADPTECARQAFYLGVPYRAAACAQYARLDGKIIVAQTADSPVLLKEYEASMVNRPTHINIWLDLGGGATARPDDADTSAGAARAASGMEEDEDEPPDVQQEEMGPIPSLAATRKPPNSFDQSAMEPTKARPVVLMGGGCTKREPAWQVDLEVGTYGQDRLGTELRTRATRAIGGAQASLQGLARLRFHRSVRVVLFGSGSGDFSVDASLIGVLHDPQVLTQYGVAVAPAAGASPLRHLRPGPPLARAGIPISTPDEGGGAFLEACLGNEYDGSVRSIVVEQATDVPVLASKRCGATGAFDYVLHVGGYGGDAADQDLMGARLDVPSLRYIRVASGFEVHTFEEPRFGKPFETVRGPGDLCVPDGRALGSLRVILAPATQG